MLLGVSGELSPSPVIQLATVPRLLAASVALAWAAAMLALWGVLRLLGAAAGGAGGSAVAGILRFYASSWLVSTFLRL